MAQFRSSHRVCKVPALRRMPAPDEYARGRYGVASSAGPIGGAYLDRPADSPIGAYALDTREEAETLARTLSRSGVVGECWVVSYT